MGDQLDSLRSIKVIDHINKVKIKKNMISKKQKEFYRILHALLIKISKQTKKQKKAEVISPKPTANSILNIENINNSLLEH